MAQSIKIDNETLRKLQLKEMESLLFFKDFCEKMNFDGTCWADV